MNAVDKFEEISRVSKNISKELKAIAKLRENAPDFNDSPAKRNRHRDNINSRYERINELEFRLHVLCVDVGAADYRGNRFYEDAIVYTDGAFSEQRLVSREKPESYPLKED